MCDITIVGLPSDNYRVNCIIKHSANYSLINTNITMTLSCYVLLV